MMLVLLLLLNRTFGGDVFGLICERIELAATLVSVTLLTRDVEIIEERASATATGSATGTALPVDSGCQCTNCDPPLY